LLVVGLIHVLTVYLFFVKYLTHFVVIQMKVNDFHHLYQGRLIGFAFFEICDTELVTLGKCVVFTCFTSLAYVAELYDNINL